MELIVSQKNKLRKIKKKGNKWHVEISININKNIVTSERNADR